MCGDLLIVTSHPLWSFFKEVDKTEFVWRWCRGCVFGSELKHSWYLSFDRSKKWRRCWSIWHSGDDIKFFESGWCEFRIESWCKIQFLFRFGLVYHWLPVSSFWISYYDNGNLRCHEFGVLDVIIGSFDFDTLQGFLLCHFWNTWPVPTMLP